MSPPHPDEGEEDDASGDGVVRAHHNGFDNVTVVEGQEQERIAPRQLWDVEGGLSTAEVERLIADVDGVAASKNKCRCLLCALLSFGVGWLYRDFQRSPPSRHFSTPHRK